MVIGNYLPFSMNAETIFREVYPNVGFCRGDN
jgi:hypothetical protein